MQRAEVWKRLLVMSLVAALTVAAGCGGDDDDSNAVAPPTATPTHVATATPTATPVLNTSHVEIFLGSTAPGGGAVQAHFEFVGSIALFLADCLGGQAPGCTGGTAVYTAGSPGFEPLEADVPAESRYALSDGTALTLRVTAIDPPLTLKIEDVTVRKVGDTVPLGTIPFHDDAETQLAIPGGAALGAEYRLSFKISAAVPAYTESAEYTVVFVPTEGVAPTPEAD